MCPTTSDPTLTGLFCRNILKRTQEDIFRYTPVRGAHEHAPYNDTEEKKGLNKVIIFVIIVEIIFY